MKKLLKILIPLIVLIAIFFAIYPTIEIEKDSKLIALRYSSDLSEFEDELSPDERYTYYADRDISIKQFDFKKFLFFWAIVMDYEEGNLIETQYQLEESYIDDFIENAEILENETNADVADLIKGKTAIVSGTVYSPVYYDEIQHIFYKLHGEENIMLIYEVDGLLVLQVGYTDEGPRYIAYQ
ncbi:MAG: hypothetical protein IKU44_01145 [Firmicutes bacterium]|nr:hypothetical protein [Bacillota bacterium]